MRSLFVKMLLIAMLAGSANLVALTAEDRESTGSVPARADDNNPDNDVYRATDVINLPVKNDDGAEVGRIKDLVINGSSREVLYAVVAMNDAKQEDSLYVMPWSVFQPSYGQTNTIQYSILTIPQSVWSQAPYYSTAQWRKTPFSQWGPRVNDYYSKQNSVGRTARQGSTEVRANKPNLNDDDSKKSDSSKNSPVKSNDKPDNQPGAEKPSTKPNTPREKNAEAPKPNTAKQPTPKSSESADSKASDAPRDPKTPAPLPK